MPVAAGIRDLKARLSGYLRRVRSGETIIVTDRGKPIARIVPVGRPVPERLHDVVEAGLVEWAGGGPGSDPPPVRVRGRRTVADLLLSDRE